MDHRPKCEGKIIKNIEDSIGEYLHVIEFDKDSFNRTQKAITLMGNNKLDFIECENLNSSKNTK